MDDVHKKACKFLCERYSTIIIPEFNVQQMTKKQGRRIHTKSVRSMLHWSHYRFRQRLLFKASEYPGVTVHVVTEEYTSKTCGMCGDVHERLGGNKHFRCPSCGWHCDRDVNGARNILLKTLPEHCLKGRNEQDRIQRAVADAEERLQTEMEDTVVGNQQ